MTADVLSNAVVRAERQATPAARLRSSEHIPLRQSSTSAVIRAFHREARRSRRHRRAAYCAGALATVCRATRAIDSGSLRTTVYEQNVTDSPGVGKSHLATALGVKACMRGYSVLFTTIQHLASQLSSAIADLSVEKLITQYVDADLIVLDELGFTPLNKVVADHIFRIVSERYERGAIILTSNKPFELWGEMFADPILATAVLDRLIHHAHILPITGDSFRTKDRRPPANAKTASNAGVTAKTRAQ
jgi:hypothetical protein